jgi:uncharacterized membrane protein
MWAAWLACGLAFASVVALLIEMRLRRGGRVMVLASGLLAAVSLVLAVTRPVRIAARESLVGPRVIVLADESRSMDLPSDRHPTRKKARDEAIAALSRNAKDARITTLGFGEGAAFSIEGSAPARARSDLMAALTPVLKGEGETPSAIVVVSDGRLDEPVDEKGLHPLIDGLNVPIHTIATTEESLPDATIFRVAASGAAVAHVPLPLKVEVLCAGGLSCEKLTVTARELKDNGPPTLLASGFADVKDGRGTVDLTITLESFGPRIVEVALGAPPGDKIPENNRRFVTFNVARERVRVLHVAGRPTNDVRALRQWLKSDASIDLVAFFILRTPTDEPRAPNDELALIPFPVDELFEQHLASFDAVILQDFEVAPYGLRPHLPRLAAYVKERGGGLVMVGGPASFGSGGYARTPLADVLPVKLDAQVGGTKEDLGTFTPSYTDVGRSAPILSPLRKVTGEEFPAMEGANVVGDLAPSSVALLTHPTRTTPSGAKMPILAVGEVGSGRSIALAVDGAWELEYSPLGARTQGRGYAALWEGLLGWLMRDPRYEPAQIVLPSGCTVGTNARLKVRAAAGIKAEGASVTVKRLDEDKPPFALKLDPGTDLTQGVELALPPLPEGGYTARVAFGNGPSTSLDFACEAGGDEWADPRPDPDRLRAIAKETHGQFAWAWDPTKLDLPKPTVVSAERQVVAVAPAWAWSLMAAVMLGAHWWVRRKRGYG